MKLPRAERAEIDQRKLSAYVLDPEHPEGRHKARVFLSALGLTAFDAQWLAAEILARLPFAEAVPLTDTRWGRTFRVDLDIRRGSRCAKVRTGWICTSEVTRLLTCFVIGECDETA